MSQSNTQQEKEHWKHKDPTDRVIAARQAEHRHRLAASIVGDNQPTATPINETLGT
jgi:PIN domain nuclease of toxin-antitoxin system